MQLPGVEDDLDKIKDRLNTRMNWIWDFDLQAHVDEAKELMAEKQRL